MPMYTFKCEKCGTREEVIRPMINSDLPVACECGRGMMNRDFKTDAFHTPSGGYSKHIVSDSMAMAIDQIPEHKRLFPNIEVTPEGQPVFDNYADHDAYLEKCKYVKHPAKRINNSGKTVITMSDIRAQLAGKKVQ